MITLDDLYQPQSYAFDFPDVPNYAYRYEDIPRSLRRNRKDDILSGLAQAFGGGFSSGHFGQALAAAAAQINAARDQEVVDYRQHQERGFQAQERQAEKSAQLLSLRQKEQAEKEKAQRVLAVYQQTQGTLHPADQASAARLDAAARALDIDEIQKIAQSAAERGSMYTQGVNPDDPTAIAKYKHDMEMKKYQEQQDLQMQANIKQAQELRRLGLTAPPQPDRDPVATALAIQRGLQAEGLGPYRPDLLRRYANEANRPPSIDPLAKMAAESSRDPLTGQIDEKLYKQNMDTLTRMLRGGNTVQSSVPKVGGTINAGTSPSHAAPTGPGGKPPVNPLKPPQAGYPKEVMAKPEVRAKILELEKKNVPREQILKLLRQAGLIK